MLRKYGSVFFVAALLFVVMTSSGCYTVLKMRTGTVSYPDYDYYDLYDYWYDPFFYYHHPYRYYYYGGWCYSPWTYWSCEPYWSYPYYYWRSRYYSYDPYPRGEQKWQKSQRRRGFQTRTLSPRYIPSRSEVSSRNPVGREEKRFKRLRRMGTGSDSKPGRRSGITHTRTSTSRAGSRSAPALSRHSSRSSSPSQAARSSSRSTPTRRRGTRR